MLAASWRKEHNLQVFDFGTGKLLQDIPFDDHKSMVSCFVRLMMLRVIEVDWDGE